MSCPKCGAATAIADPRCRQCGSELNRPYAVSPAALEQSTPAAALKSPYGGFWRRVGAFAMDGFVLAIVGQGLGLAFGASFASLGQSGRWIGFLVAALYVIPAHHLWGQTLGKRVLDLRVQRLEGGRLSVAAASVRYLALAVPWFLNGLFFSAPQWPSALLIAVGVILGSVLFVGILGNLYLLIFNRPSRRLLHDWVAGTVVVRASPSRAAVPAAGVRVTPLHMAIVGLIPVVVFAALGSIALRTHVTPGQIAQLQSTQEALSHSPGVLQGSLVDQQNFSAQGRTHVIAAQLWVAEADAAKRRVLGRQAAATILKQYPNSRTADRIAIVCRWGFDIGIASTWRSDGEVHSVADWKRLLGNASP